jgi:uncharacterized membrane protein
MALFHHDAGPPDEKQTLVAISFPDHFRATEFVTAAARLASQGHLAIRDAVIVTKDDEGKAHVRETRDLQPSTTAFSSGIWGGLIGLLLAGPIGMVVVGGVSAGLGAVAAKAVDLGIPDEWVAWLRQAVQPGNTVVALLVAQLDIEPLLAELERFEGAHLLYGNLPEAVLDRAREALGDKASSTAAPASPAIAGEPVPAPGEEATS